MKVVGLITEYNPFHNGHLYHIAEAKRITKADYAVVVMSGNFVQRGAPAIIDKYSRTQMALSCGADIVFELPVIFSTASAEIFALGAISLLDKLGVVNDVCFGSELGDTALLVSIAHLLLEEPEEYQTILKSTLKNGLTFPNARMEAIRTLYPDIDHSALLSPNNILGIEYMKALIRLKSSINPVTIGRISSGYHDTKLPKSATSSISSATAIRKALQEKVSIQSLSNHVPKPVYDLLSKEYRKSFPIFEDDYSLLLRYQIMQESRNSLQTYLDISSDLANRILSMNTSGFTYSELAQAIKSKHWTLTRINRALAHILLQLKKEDFYSFQNAGYSQYARILGLKKDSSSLLRIIKKNGQIPVITKMADSENILSETGRLMLKEDIFASHLYNHVVFEKYHTVLKDEYTRGILFQ